MPALRHVSQAAIILNKENKALVLKYSDDYEESTRSKWGFPGGQIEDQDKSLEEALVREVKEELGIEIKVLHPIYVTTFKNPGKANSHIWIGYLCETENSNINLSHEHTEYKWVAADENLLWLNPEMPQMIKKAAEMKKRIK